MSPLIAARFETPVGDLHVIAADGVVQAAGFRPLRDVVTQLPSGVRGPVEQGDLPQTADAVAAWADGDGSGLAQVPVALHGGPFAVEAWTQLRTVPPGEVVTYQELAQMAGSPRAMRAAGTACARNAVGLFVPCHRVVAAGGRLGGYGLGGPAIKAQMLRHEGVAVAAGPVTEATLVGEGA